MGICGASPLYRWLLLLAPGRSNAASPKLCYQSASDPSRTPSPGTQILRCSVRPLCQSWLCPLGHVLCLAPASEPNREVCQKFRDHGDDRWICHRARYGQRSPCVRYMGWAYFGSPVSSAQSGQVRLASFGGDASPSPMRPRGASSITEGVTK